VALSSAGFEKVNALSYSPLFSVDNRLGPFQHSFNMTNRLHHRVTPQTTDTACISDSKGLEMAVKLALSTAAHAYWLASSLTNELSEVRIFKNIEVK
jgi:hypothetical protein